ncbi:PREDICTED: uncharacterized protein LOC109154164 [Ipomoea nil]|uniref:uncharacterized protein LOC109154164 n=1 Tax=Ipomoea nil TaxID=35883 RepID=UPI000900BC2E|nr:PREDICTED: uncharacterized protein LOC109154164 [Ipomoea nil]
MIGGGQKVPSKTRRSYCFGRNTAREVWESVTTSLGSSTRARCLNLLGKFQNFRQGGSSPVEYLDREELIVESLSLAGRPLSSKEQILYVLRGLRPEYRALAAALTATDAPVTLLQLADLLQAQEFIHSDDLPALDDTSSTQPTALFAGRGQRHGDQNSGGRHPGQGCGGGRRGRGKNGGQNRGRGGAPRCQICRSHGHIVLNCYKQYADSPQANATVAGDPPLSADMDTWYPDTGATSYATLDAQMLDHSEVYTGGDVLCVGSGAGFDVSSIGHVTIRSVLKPLNLSRILHVPKLSLPLLSVHKFSADNNVFFEFNKDVFFCEALHHQSGSA